MTKTPVKTTVAHKPTPPKSSTTSVVRSDDRMHTDRAAENERNADSRLHSGDDTENVVHDTDAAHPAASIQDVDRDPLGQNTQDPLSRELDRQHKASSGGLSVDQGLDGVIQALIGIKNNLPANGDMSRAQVDQLDLALGRIIRDNDGKANRKIARNA